MTMNERGNKIFKGAILLFVALVFVVGFSTLYFRGRGMRGGASPARPRPSSSSSSSILLRASEDEGRRTRTITSIATFNRDVAPILFQNCAPCHRPGQSAPFSLLNYADALKHAKQIAEVTQKHYMPPWLPD